MKKIVASFIAALALAFAGSAHAAIPVAATDAFSTFTTDAGTFVDMAWPLAVAVVIGLAFVRLFKKVVSRAT